MVRKIGKVLANEKVKGAFDSIGGGFGGITRGANSLYTAGTDALSKKAHSMNRNSMNKKLSNMVPNDRSASKGEVFFGGQEARGIRNAHDETARTIDTMHSIANKKSTKIAVGVGAASVPVVGTASYVATQNERSRNAKRNQ